MAVYTIVRNSDGLIVNKIVLDDPSKYPSNPNFTLIQGDVGDIGYYYVNGQVQVPQDIQQVMQQIQQAQSSGSTNVAQLVQQLHQLRMRHYVQAVAVFVHEFLGA